MMKPFFLFFFGICAIQTSITSVARAGIFNLQQFVEYQNWAIGLEPEITLTNGGGVGANLKFTYGITPLSNLQVTLGDGSGARKFRTGVAYTFDFIPDIDGQFGAGLIFQAFLYRLKTDSSQTELSIAPYLHKSFKTEAGYVLDPYFALPMGMDFVNGTYKNTFQLAGGVFYKYTEHVGYNAELGINLKDTDSYIALGVTYKH